MADMPTFGVNYNPQRPRERPAAAPLAHPGAAPEMQGPQHLAPPPPPVVVADDNDPPEPDSDPNDDMDGGSEIEMVDLEQSGT